MMKANNQLGFININEDSIDKILKDGDVVFERGFLREKTSTTLPITFGGVGKDLKDYKVYGNTVQSKLPSGYTQVDYIESSGTQYIDTGINADINLDVKIDMQYTDINASNNDTNFGAIYHEGTIYRRYHAVKNNGKFSWYVLSNVNTIVSFDILRHTFYIKASERKIVFDEVEYNMVETTQTNPNINFWLFGRNSNDSDLIFYISSRLYSCQMYYNNELVRDFIPCYRNSDNEVGLYDLVNNVFYINQGTGVFTYGSIAPTPDAPIDMESCGDLITDTLDTNYGKYKIPINVKSDNIFSNNIIENGYLLEESGTITANSNYYICKETNIKPLSKYILSENQNYSVSTFTPVRVCAYDKNDNFIALLLSNRRTEVKRYVDKFVIPENTNYILIGFRNSDTNIELVESIDTNIYLDEPLRKIDEYSDYIDFINGKIVRRIKETLLDDSITWLTSRFENEKRIYTSTSNIDSNMRGVTSNAQNVYLLSNQYKSETLTDILALSIKYGIGVSSTNYFSILNQDYSTSTEFLQALHDNPITLDYRLRTPTEEPITLPNIPTIDGNNTLNIETEITPSQVYIKYKSNE